MRVILVDLIVGLRAENHADMSLLRPEYERWPVDLPIYPALQALGPILFLAGLLTLAVLLTLEHRLLVWSAPLLVAGFVLISANLDLMPVGGALLGLAFVSAVRTTPAVDAVRAPGLGDQGNR